MSRAPDPRTARTRAAIISATELLLHTEGSNASVAQIAKQAGVSVGSVYLHFGSKDELVEQVILLAWERRTWEFDAAREADRPLDRILAFGDAVVEFARTEPVAFRALRVRALDPSATSSLTEDTLFADRLAELESDLAEVASGAGTPPATLAVLLLATWTGLAERLVRRDALRVDPDLATAVRHAAASVLTAGLAAPAAAL